MTVIRAPFTPDQVEALNRWQTVRRFHPFTCGDRDEHGDEGTLVATEAGWSCPACDYTQDWAHDFMLEEQADTVQRHTIGLDVIAGIRISTCWLDIPDDCDVGLPPLLETMVFGGPLHMEQVKHSTVQAATETHLLLVEATHYAIDEGIWTPVDTEEEPRADQAR